MSSKPKVLEDTWTFQEVGTPFPQNAVKAHGQANMYVALGYKHGKPFMGRAWNDSGVVQCSFIMNGTVQQGKEIGGSIQLLTYSKTHSEVGFWYDWIPFTRWKEEEARDMFAVRCGASVPVFLQEMVSLGYLDTGEGKAYMQVGERKFETVPSTSPKFNNLLVLCRMIHGGPPHCQCPICATCKTKKRAPLMVNDWVDYKEGDRFPVDKPVHMGLGRALATPWGNQEQFVALWYRHGKPVMGRAWNDSGNIGAAFVDQGRVYHGRTVGSLQLLVELPPLVAGYDYKWIPYEEVAANREAPECLPLHMDHVAPCVICINNTEILGGINLKLEVAECTLLDGTLKRYEGGQLKNFLVLCRKERDDTMWI
ncbi:unnamed protein product, partial [Mesorhabditis spiculigera]